MKHFVLLGNKNDLEIVIITTMCHQPSTEVTKKSKSILRNTFFFISDVKKHEVKLE